MKKKKSKRKTKKETKKIFAAINVRERELDRARQKERTPVINRSIKNLYHHHHHIKVLCTKQHRNLFFTFFSKQSIIQKLRVEQSIIFQQSNFCSLAKLRLSSQDQLSFYLPKDQRLSRVNCCLSLATTTTSSFPFSQIKKQSKEVK